jgi:hypothetical protein
MALPRGVCIVLKSKVVPGVWARIVGQLMPTFQTQLAKAVCPEVFIGVAHKEKPCQYQETPDTRRSMK